ncbi:hypothetical protein QLL95_gp0486 [Cotonvirus japonicus]|uniref:Ankyrin repeat protein n=1 Tax=Cotonvirus japonicus TaxID=2811091 RepID=A0ABM7NU99_9VIRU|nr:hypothetical protein QLL95_gp0486 [Cotonvirus japonicus]BCS83637.1 hypothetical protein [Cotonvirus japonicus]
MPEYKFKFCLNIRTRNEIKKHCKKSQKMCRLYVNDSEYIKVNFRKNTNHYHMEIDADDLSVFINFVYENYLFCNGHENIKHSCKMNNYFKDYVNFITKNNKTEHLKSLIFDLGILFEQSFHDGICGDTICYVLRKMHEHSSENTINAVFNTMTMKEFNRYIESPKIDIDVKVINTIMCKYQNYYYECYNYFVNNRDDNSKKYKKRIMKLRNNTINYYILHKIFDRDNAEVYNLFINKVNELIEEISSFKFNDKSIKSSKFGESFIENFNECIDELSIFASDKQNFYKCLQLNSPNIAELIIRENYDIKMLRPSIIILRDIAEHDKLYLLELLLDNKMVSFDKINMLFLESHKYSRDVVEILINYDADVNMYGQKVLKCAEKNNNREVIEYLQEILN